MIAVFVLLVILFVIAAFFFSYLVFRWVFCIAAGCFLAFLLLMLAGFVGVSGLFTKKNAAQLKVHPLSRFSLKVFLPVLLAASNFLKYARDEIRRVYIRANNEIVLSMGIKANPDKTLVILPHCIQSSRCLYRIRKGLEDCHQCGACIIGEIRDIIKRYGVHAELATGGTSARKIIMDKKPEFVIAVACERDLSSGIMDVRGLPVFGILNQRPNGPCKDTLIDIGDLEDKIRRFTSAVKHQAGWEKGEE